MMAYLSSLPEKIRPFVQARSLRGSFDLQGLAVEVSVQVPDLSTCTTSIWGDWGPIYRFELAPDQHVHIRYECAAKGLEAEGDLTPPTVGLRSPMLAEERSHTPFYLDIVDSARNLRLKAYLDRAGHCKRVVAEPLHSGIDAKTLVFPELRGGAPVTTSKHAPRDHGWKKAG